MYVKKSVKRTKKKKKEKKKKKKKKERKKTTTYLQSTKKHTYICVSIHLMRLDVT